MNKNPELIGEIKGHKNTILSCKFSPDSKNVIAAGLENSIYFHKLNQSNYFYKILAHDDLIYSLDYAECRNQQFFLSGSRDRTVKLWKIDSLGKEIISQDFDPVVYYCQNTVRFVNISALNSSIFCTGSDDKTIKVWSANVPNKRLNTFTNHKNWIRCCKFSRKDSNLIASCSDDSTLRLFDLRINGMKGSILKTITTSRNRHFTHLDWYPLSEYFIAISSSNSMIRIFDLRQLGRIVQLYKPFQDSVNCLDFHPDGHYLLASSSDSTSKLINVVEGRLIYTLKGHYKSIFNCTFNKDGSRFITSGKDKSLKLWKSNFEVTTIDDYLDNEINDNKSTISTSTRCTNQNESINNERIYSLINERRMNSSLNEMLNDELDDSQMNLNDKRMNLFDNQSLNRVKNFESSLKASLDESLEDRINEKIDAIIAKRTRNRTTATATRAAINKQHINKQHIDKQHTNKQHTNKCSSMHSNKSKSNHDHCSPDHNSLEIERNAFDLENLNSNRKEVTNKHRSIRTELANNSELDCIFNQLSLLEKYLSRLEIRLISLESKLST